MRELTCGEARDLASELLDGDLMEADAEAVLAHVSTCATCPGLYRALVLVRARLAAIGSAPEGESPA
ncbi:MAG: zf-HC2 domain-containing protein [Candidatus Dormibacteraeota bacterium]|jgi:predicted anti-sigma-YlaC factor YlaD|nr:zf-HC2 domain-containing protein [Candidatus Dormibacteraeota bacterium]